MGYRCRKGEENNEMSVVEDGSEEKDQKRRSSWNTLSRCAFVRKSEPSYDQSERANLPRLLGQRSVGTRKTEKTSSSIRSMRKKWKMASLGKKMMSYQL